jgi:hypothetical protein
MGYAFALVLAVLALLARAAALDQPADRAPEAKPAGNDLVCSLESVQLASRVTPGGKSPARCTASASLKIKAPEGVVCAARHGVITQVLDEGRRDILIKRGPEEVRAEDERRELTFELRNSLRDQHGDARGYAQAELVTVPPTISSFGGEVDVFVARNVVRQKIELKAMEEPLQLTPGLTFLLTSAEPQERQDTTRISFEVRTRHRRGAGGTEPVFGGLIALQRDGRPSQTLDSGQELDTRDEHIVVVKDMEVYTKDVVGWQVWALDGIEKVRLTFRAKQLKIAEEVQ